MEILDLIPFIVVGVFFLCLGYYLIIEKIHFFDALLSSLFYSLIVIGVSFVILSPNVSLLSQPLKDQIQTFALGLAIISLCLACTSQIRNKYTFERLLDLKFGKNLDVRVNGHESTTKIIQDSFKVFFQKLKNIIFREKTELNFPEVRNETRSTLPSSQQYSSDIPLTNPSADRLGYANIAKNIAIGINAISEPNGFVVSINAKWGTGKTTFLNFIDFYLSNIETDGGILEETNTKPIIVRFNPWWFTGKEDLYRQFFAQFGLGLRKEYKSIIQITRLFGDYLTAISKVNPKFPDLYRPYNSTMDAIEKTFNLELMDVITSKQRIIDELPKDKKIIIIIDDIDRLNTDEIKQIFQVIKIIADFPNIIYVLAFDRTVVEPMLDSVQNAPGAKYLEKIIQAPFDLPTPTKLSLNVIQREKLKELMGIYPKERWDNKHWLNVYRGGISELIDTPRHIVRLTNTLRVTYPPIKDEVNPIDFIALEILRLFVPEYYEKIQKNSGYFCGFPSHVSSYEREEFKKFHLSLLSAIDSSKREPVAKIIKSIFPIVASVLDSHDAIDTHDAHKLRREMRICYPEFFSIYFWMTVPQDSLSAQEFDLIKGFFNNRETLRDELVRIANENESGLNKIDLLLLKLIDYSPSITKNEAIEIIYAIYDVFDDLLKIERQQNNTDGIINSYNKIWLVRLLLSSLPDDERLDIIKQIVNTNKTLFSILWDLYSIIQDPSQNECECVGARLREVKPLINPDRFEELKKLTVDRIENYSERSELEKSFRLFNILLIWNEWGSKEKSQLWVKNQLQNDAGLLFILENFTHFRIYSSRAMIEYIDFENLLKFIDKSDLMAIIQSHIETLNQRTDLNFSQQKIVQRLNKILLGEQKADKEKVV